MKRFRTPATLAALGFATLVIPFSFVLAQGNPLVLCEGVNCQLCSFAQLAQSIIRFTIILAIPIAAILFAYAGALYITAGGNPGQIEKAHGIFGRVAFGFVLALSGWLIVNTILVTIADPRAFSSGNFFTIQCVTNRPMDKTLSDLLSGTPTVSNPTSLTGLTIQCPAGSFPNTSNQCEMTDGRIVPAVANSYGGVNPTCSIGSTWNATLAGCVNVDGEVVPPIAGNISGTAQTINNYSCANCAPIDSSIPVRNTNVCSSQVGGNCQMDVALGNSMVGFYQELRGAGQNGYVSEAWPPTVYHASADQNSGTSVDWSGCNSNNGVTGSSAQAGCIASTVSAANNNGLRAVYEVSNAAERDAIIASSGGRLNSSNVISVGYISGNHFSIYRARL